MKYIYIGECTQTGVHFFLDDYQFERIWNRPTVYVKQLSKFALVALHYSQYGCGGNGRR
ncbi:DUF4417 domain-containing protein [uncultured Megasphaera sp.]|uniref:DUF4417 domain-containing protein n=1 Tax=uncultured Megasphaera sp. TaxID=165188 RepID=UPI002596A73F|nr:DUF4417 domain-containing protein [uncultured Megasphaera sp.]